MAVWTQRNSAYNATAAEASNTAPMLSQGAEETIIAMNLAFQGLQLLFYGVPY